MVHLGYRDICTADRPRNIIYMILVNLKHLSSHLGGNCNERNINQFGVIAHVFEYPEEEKNSSHKKWSPAEEDLIRRQVELRRTQIHHMKDGHLFADTWWYIIRFKMRMESKHEYKNTSRLHMIFLYVLTPCTNKVNENKQNMAGNLYTNHPYGTSLFIWCEMVNNKRTRWQTLKHFQRNKRYHYYATLAANRQKKNGGP